MSDEKEVGIFIKISVLQAMSAHVFYLFCRFAKLDEGHKKYLSDLRKQKGKEIGK